MLKDKVKYSKHVIKQPLVYCWSIVITNIMMNSFMSC